MAGKMRHCKRGATVAEVVAVGPEHRAEIEPRERTCGLRRGSRGEARGRADRD